MTPTASSRSMRMRRHWAETGYSRSISPSAAPSASANLRNPETVRWYRRVDLSKSVAWRIEAAKPDRSRESMAS